MFLFFLLLILLTVSTNPVLAQEYQLDRPLGIQKLADGNILVTDGGGANWSNNGSEVFIFNPKGQVEWHYKGSLIFSHTAKMLPKGQIIITDTTNNRLIAIEQKSKKTLWTSNDWPIKLDYPNSVELTKDGYLLITDRNHNRILKVTMDGKLVDCLTGFNRPHHAYELNNGQILISDSENHRVLLINWQGDILWQMGKNQGLPLNWPRDVDLLTNGHYLVTDTRNHRVIEINSAGKILWQFDDLYWPYEAERLTNGNTLISDSQKRRVIEVTPDKKIVNQIKTYQFQPTTSKMHGSFESWQPWPSDNNQMFIPSSSLGQVDMNLLANGQVPTGWSPGVLLAEGKARLSQDNKEAKQGNSSARIDSLGDNYVFWHKRIAVTSGRYYQLSGWIKTKLQNSANPKSLIKKTSRCQEISEPEFNILDKRTAAWLEIWWEATDGSFIDQPNITNLVKNISDWQKRGWSGKAPPEAVAANIRTMVRGNGTAWFDDILWQESLFPPFSASEKIGWFISGVGAFLLLSYLKKRLKR